ncbi:hypothetical protein BEN47_03005 [Hymenobacter lapidarius]|uniref:Uncharacterized protein n=1 Tax=Hymenobacter lapidarius TaxID=1908237 RepID=A0A1G1T0I6_9BACT|nr:hypothetical protein [Hymenobacter lapidarius]OGX84346.1 hypothetical protein BEN47_03005 [Hymenobacter lapidarius]
MYDFLQFRFDLPPGTDAERLLATAPALAAAEYATTTGGTGGPRLKASYRGLRLDYWPDLRRGRVRGSLHSFAYGHNAGPFPAAAVALACRELAAAVGVAPELLVVQRLEAGLNLTLPTAPRPILEGLTQHKNRPFVAVVPPARAPRPLEFVVFHTDYRLKAYDKGTYARLSNATAPPWAPLSGLLLPVGLAGNLATLCPWPGTGTALRDQYAPAPVREELLLDSRTVQNRTFHGVELPAHLLRLEAVYLRARALILPGLPGPLTLADLPAPGTLAIFAQHLRRLWLEVQHRAVMEFPPNLTPNEAALLVAGAMPEYWNAIRPTAAPATYKRARAKYRELRAAQTQHAGPHPLTPLLEAELQPWLAPADVYKC